MTKAIYIYIYTIDQFVVANIKGFAFGSIVESDTSLYDNMGYSDMDCEEVRLDNIAFGIDFCTS